jgi:hypothetical protein
MARLFHPAQPRGRIVAMGDDEADDLDVETQAALEVGDQQLDVARARDVERRRVAGFGGLVMRPLQDGLRAVVPPLWRCRRSPRA